MPNCGSQCWLCDLPIRFDTYVGCSHACEYCFVKKCGIVDIKDIKKGESVQALKKFVEGERTRETSWCDWNIPLHWGGESDPFQPCEKIYGYSLECLKYLAETQYPFVVSTKGRLIVEPEYLDVLSKCNCVVQISAVCSKYNDFELGAPSFEERMEMVKILSKRVKRVIVRCQPYMCEIFKYSYANLDLFKEMGAYGVIFEGMKYFKKKKGLVKVGGDMVYPYAQIRKDFEKLKAKAHRIGLKFYAGENRLRGMGDSLSCCGFDGLEGFKGNTYNINHFLHGDFQQPTEAMLKAGSAQCFQSIEQTAKNSKRLKEVCFADEMQRTMKKRENYIKDVFGISKK